MLIAAASSSMLALAAPGLASAAHKSKCHHHAHHACANSRHASRARVLTFGRPSSTTLTPGSPSAPTAPASEPPETAGTVASFTGGVLTITLKDGSTVSGKVTESTELRCQSGAPPTEASDDDQNGDEASGGNGDDGAPQGGPLAGTHGDDMSGGGDGGDGGAAGQPSTCTTAALVPGAVVAEAELSVGGSSGAVWDHVDLIS
jgi:hypothetical protein